MGPDGIILPADPTHILNGREDLGTPKLRAAVASLTSEKIKNIINIKDLILCWFRICFSYIKKEK